MEPSAKSQCQTENCQNASESCGWCRPCYAKEYQRALRKGTLWPDARKARTIPVEERFLRHVEKSSDPDGCWLWTAGIDKDGYGCFSTKQPQNKRWATHRAHRIAYFLWVGETDLTIDHACHNRSDCEAGSECPHRRCVNPAHLEAVTVRRNSLSGKSFAAKNARKTHCKQGHPLSGDNLRTKGKGERVCRICASAEDRARTAAWTPERLERKRAYARELQRKKRAAFRAANPKVRKTHCMYGHPFDEENTYIAADGTRHCKECRRRLVRANQQKKRAEREASG